jgi:hypothetical protein
MYKTTDANSGHLINHVSVVLDASTSMQPRARDLIQVMNNLVEHLSAKSQQMGQEVRVSIYSFSTHDKIRCLIWDRDVMRLPDIATLYRVGGMTALIDATMVGLADMDLISEKYGNHAHLMYVLTDGIENASLGEPGQLRAKIGNRADNRTVATFVPDPDAAMKAARCGFPAGNIAVWDTLSPDGLADLGFVIRDATDTFMEARASGTCRGTTSLFTLNQPSASVVTSELTKLTPGSWAIYPCLVKSRADEFVKSATGKSLVLGRAYYELTKPETIQPHKNICVLASDGSVYTGAKVRDLLGLPDYNVKVYPAAHTNYKIFIQSTAPNRNFMPGTSVLVLR